jgi:hypothetical protein
MGRARGGGGGDRQRGRGGAHSVRSSLVVESRGGERVTTKKMTQGDTVLSCDEGSFKSAPPPGRGERRAQPGGALWPRLLPNYVRHATGKALWEAVARNYDLAWNPWPVDQRFLLFQFDEDVSLLEQIARKIVAWARTGSGISLGPWRRFASTEQTSTITRRRVGAWRTGGQGDQGEPALSARPSQPGVFYRRGKNLEDE